MNYEINKETLAIIPIEETKSKVVELNSEYIVNTTPYKIMENSCMYFGSSIKGRLDGSKGILGSVYKPPILVEESRNIVFFPTMSPQLANNCWISLNNIKDYKNDGFSTIINFDNNKQIKLDIPFLSIENQILRATRLQSIYRKRKNCE